MAKKTNLESENYRGRVHTFMLYPDCEEHVKAVKIIEQTYDYALILHDRDYFTEEDEKENPEHVSGTLKKKHWHIIIRVQNPIWRSALSKELGLTENYIRRAKSFDSALQYLIHYNDVDKAQYQIDEVKGNLKIKLIESINKIEKSEGEKVSDLICYIECQTTKIRINDFAKYCAQNGYWSEFRRSASIFLKIIEEHNNGINGSR